MLRTASQFLRIAYSPLPPCAMLRYSTLSERIAEREREKLKQYVEETKEFIEKRKHKEDKSIDMKRLKMKEITNNREISEKDVITEEKLERMHEEGFDRDREKPNCPIF